MAGGAGKNDALKAQVKQFYDDMQQVVNKDPDAEIGQPSIRLLRDLVHMAKENGGDAAMCDKLIEALRVPPSAKFTAADALAIAGQLQLIVKAGPEYGKDYGIG